MIQAVVTARPARAGPERKRCDPTGVRGPRGRFSLSYPAWQKWLRTNQPALLVLWGRYDPSFQADEAEAYRRDVPGAEVHMLAAGHFALDERPDEIAELTRGFLTPLFASER